MGNRKGHYLGNSRMVHEHFVDFTGRNLFAPTVDHLLEAARDEEVTIGIQTPLVTCPEPTIREGTLRGRRIILVALGNVGTTDDNLALLTRWQQVAHFVHNGNLRPRRDAHRTSLTRIRRQWITCHLMRGFRHDVGLYYKCLEHPLQLGHDL